jgi:hypothetical protein
MSRETLVQIFGLAVAAGTVAVTIAGLVHLFAS